MATITIEIPDNMKRAFEDIGDQLPIVLEMGMSRLAPLSTKAYREAISFLTGLPSQNEPSDFRFSDDVESRIQALLQKNRDDAITLSEEIELDRLVQLEEQLQLVKATLRIHKRK